MLQFMDSERKCSADLRNINIITNRVNTDVDNHFKDEKVTNLILPETEFDEFLKQAVI